ncbi:MAG: AAA family ATPase [Candidatus Margulisiibacteriota bacterium]
MKKKRGKRKDTNETHVRSGRNSLKCHSVVLQRVNPPTEIKIPPPREIYARLSKTILGQEKALKSLSVAVYQHLCRERIFKICGKCPQKSNVLLVGPSGCGKTLIGQALSSLVPNPFVFVNAAGLVEQGYRGGMHVESIVEMLIKTVEGNSKLAEFGIVFIDEIDKLCDIEHHYSTIGVQKGLLSLIDSAIFNYELGGEEFDRKQLRTKNLLFVFAGTFNSLCSEPTAEDLIKYGFIPELAYRMGNIIEMEPFKQDLFAPLVRKMVKEYVAYMDINHSSVNVYSEIINSILLGDEKCHKSGGRAVAPLINRFFEDKLFEI